MYLVYAMVSQKYNRIHVGLTENLTNRLKEHNSGKTKSTDFYKPRKLFYYEELNCRKLAGKREKELKAGCGKEFLKGILKNKKSL